MSAPNQWRLRGRERAGEHARPVSYVPLLCMLLVAAFLVATSALYASQEYWAEAESTVQVKPEDILR